MDCPWLTNGVTGPHTLQGHTHIYMHTDIHMYTPVHTHGHTWVCMLSCFSRVRVFETLWTVASQAPLSMGFSRQEYWSGLPCPSPWGLPDAGIKSVSLTVAESFFTTSATWDTHTHTHAHTQTCTHMDRYALFHGASKILLSSHLFFFNKLKVCSNPASSRSISTTVPRAHSHFA